MISDLSQSNFLANALNLVTSNLQQIQEQLATGKRVSVPSDDPVAYAEASALNAEQSAASNDSTLGSQIQGRLNTMDGAFTSAVNAINSAIQTATQGASGTVNASQMATLATQAQGTLQELIAAGNQQYLNAYVFGGNQSLNAPFSGAGAYSGDTGSNSVTFSNGTAVQLSSDGQAIFGDNTSGAIGAIVNLVSALQSGNEAAVSATLPQLQTALQQVATAQAALGNGLAMVNNIVNNANSEVTSLTTASGNLVDADVASLAAQESELQLQQQALVSVESGLAKESLVDVLA